MTESEARRICEEEGYTIKNLIENIDGYFRFLCKGGFVVSVWEGQAIVEPT